MIKIGTHDFEGPYASSDELEDRSGVYLILCLTGSNTTVIDVGESAKVKTRIENHDRIDCWTEHCGGKLRFLVLYTPGVQAAGRKKIEQALRQKYQPPCGER